MATLKQRLHKMNSSGSYDTVHLETESSLVLRPSGRTVEQDLTDYLPEVQDSDTVPESLRCHKWYNSLAKEVHYGYIKTKTSSKEWFQLRYIASRDGSLFGANG